MRAQPIEVVSIECYSGHKWVLYFSDDTFADVDAAELASCFPDRSPIGRGKSARPEDDSSGFSH